MTIGRASRPVLAAVTLPALAAPAGCGKDDKDDDVKGAAATTSRWR